MVLMVRNVGAAQLDDSGSGSLMTLQSSESLAGTGGIPFRDGLVMHGGCRPHRGLSSLRLDLSVRLQGLPHDMIAAFLHRERSEKQQRGRLHDLASEFLLLYFFLSSRSLSPSHT